MHPLSEELKETLQKETVHLSLPKDYFLLEAPKVSDHAFIIEQGFALSYTFVQGKKQIEKLFEPGQIILSSKSFFEQVPSQEFIQLMDQSEVLHISHSSFLRMLDTFPEANVICRMVMNRYYEQCRDRVNDLLHLNAQERYEKMHRGYPKIEQLLPQEYLASYLGIAPQSLSRLKKRRPES